MKLHHLSNLTARFTFFAGKLLFGNCGNKLDWIYLKQDLA